MLMAMAARFEVAVIGGDAALALAVEAAGGAVHALGWDEVASGDLSRCDAIVLDTSGVDDDTLEVALPRVALAAAQVVALLRADQVDAVAVDLLGEGAALLVDPADAQIAGALAMLAHRAAAALPAGVRETDPDRLARLTDDLARIVDRLAGLAGAAPATAAVDDRRLGYGAASGDAAQIDAAEVRRVIRARRLRDRAFGTGAFGTGALGAGLFEDPAWDILLDLFAAALERTEVSVSSLCIAAAVAPTTALRWIGRLTAAGLLVRQRDTADRRRALMSLSPEAFAAMRSYAAMLRGQGLPFV